MTLPAFFAAVSLCLMAAVSPGPAVLMAARIGLSEGLRTGAALAVGIGAGAVFWAAAALFGLALLFEYAPFLLTTLKIGGAAFLIWTAIKMWRAADEPLDDTATTAAPRSALAAFRLGLWTQLANPKPAVFFGAVFVGTVPTDATPLALSLLLACIFLGEFLWNTSVARLFSLDRTRKIYIGLKHLIDRVFGGLLAALGVKIAAT
ncbi:threonine/homoserine/homoserine lactone efflux protein [Shimia isoporae]|uniref:Threonine/homoserine/homoserine lactone efflux protein n=1 Tax=Shimia isoporae TaxID=647720 RepID=A0A4R1NWW6_9RHOB|nr:LysE family translocator [Shimia isoporae]TCL09642.1 threonine/homoserine/homoserine lactone efflux protein [Shimia isoporae]